MEKERMFEIVRDLFPNKSFSLQSELSYTNLCNTHTNEKFSIFIHGVIPDEKDKFGIALGQGGDWPDALRGVYRKICKYEVKEIHSEHMPKDKCNTD